jgi:hypothetical protein
MRNHWKKQMTVLFLCGLLAMFMIGCGANAPAPDNSQDVQKPQEEPKQETVTELPAVDDGIKVAAHDNGAFDRPLDEYNFVSLRSAKVRN